MKVKKKSEKLAHPIQRLGSRSLQAARTRNTTAPGRIVKEFTGIVDLTEEDGLDYGPQVCVMRPRYRIPHKVFEGLRYTDFLGPGPTYVPACNSRSRFHPTAIVRTHDFRQDRSVKDSQATNSDYRNSKFEKGHMAAAANHSKNYDDLVKTYIYTNCAPMSKACNICLRHLEDQGRRIATSYGSVLIISLSLLPERIEDVRFLNDEDRVGIAEKFGKIFIWRDQFGLNIEGWVTPKQSPYAADDKKSGDSIKRPLKTNPFELARKGMVNLIPTPEYFRTINGEKNHNHDDRLGTELCPRNPYFEKMIGYFKVNEEARLSAAAGGGGLPSQHHNSSSPSSHHYNSHRGGDSPPQTSHHNTSSSSGGLGLDNRLQASNNSVSSSMSPSYSGSSANDYLSSLGAGAQMGNSQADLSSNPALLFSTMTAIPSASLGASSMSSNYTGRSIGLTTPSTVMGLTPNFMNSTMSMAGNTSNPLNPFANSAPPPRMGNHGNNQQSLLNTVAGGPRHQNNFGMGGMNNHGNTFGAGVGANNGNVRYPQPFGPRTPFGNFGNNNNDQNQNRFQFCAIPSGRMDVQNNKDNRDKRGLSPPNDIRGNNPGVGNDLLHNRTRRSRSRDRDRTGDRRRRRSRSRSKSRSWSRDRVTGNKRRDSRDTTKDHERRSRNDSSPEKSSQESGSSRGRRERDWEPSPPPNSTNTTSKEWPGAKLVGIPADASYREIKEFIRVDVMGSSDGVVRLHDEGIAFLKLQNASEYPRVYRSNGKKLRGSAISVEGITMETWTQEYCKLNKSRIERDIDREREKEKSRRDKYGTRDSNNRHAQNSQNLTSNSTSQHQRPGNKLSKLSREYWRGKNDLVLPQ